MGKGNSCHSVTVEWLVSEFPQACLLQSKAKFKASDMKMSFYSDKIKLMTL